MWQLQWALRLVACNGFARASLYWNPQNQACLDVYSHNLMTSVGHSNSVEISSQGRYFSTFLCFAFCYSRSHLSPQMSSKTKKHKQQLKVQYDFTVKQLDGIPSKFDEKSGSLFIEWKKGHGHSNKGETELFSPKGKSFSPNVAFGFATHVERDLESQAFEKKLITLTLKFKKNKKSLMEKSTHTIGSVTIDIAPFAATPVASSEYKYDLTSKKHKKTDSVPTVLVRIVLVQRTRFLCFLQHTVKHSVYKRRMQKV